MMNIMEKYNDNIAEADRALERGDHRRAQVHLNSAARQMRQHRAMIAESMRRTRERPNTSVHWAIEDHRNGEHTTPEKNPDCPLCGEQQ